jgi:hypothetical protein
MGTWNQGIWNQGATSPLAIGPMQFVDGELPGGLQNNVNQTYNLAQAPNPPASLDLTLNGIRQQQGVNYTLAGSTIVYLTSIPGPADVQLAYYRYLTNTFQTSGGGTYNQTILNAALRKAGVSLAPGRGPSPEQIMEAIGEENRLLGMWMGGSQANIFADRVDLWTTIPNQQAHTIGIDPTGAQTANWNGPRPLKIIRANFLIPNDVNPVNCVRRPLHLWSSRDWASIRFQGVYTYPRGLYYDKQCDPNTGFASVYFRPIPDGAYQIELFTWQRLPQFSSTDNVVILPEGWEDALVNNLAVRLSSFPWTVKTMMDPQVRIDAQISLAMIQQMNVSAPRLFSDRELTNARGYFDWLSGETDDNL